MLKKQMQHPPNSMMSHYRSAEQSVRKLDIQSSHAVLDLGCGDGFHFRLAHEPKPRIVVALDIDFESLASCARAYRKETSPQARRGSFVIGDALRLPFEPGSFDRVICSLVLYMLPLKNSMQELHRIVKPGGKVYLRIPMLSGGRAISVFKELPDVRRFLYTAFHVVNGVYFAAIGRQCDYSPTRACYLPRGRFEETARAAGFEFEGLEVDRTRPMKPSMEVWLRKI